MIVIFFPPIITGLKVLEFVNSKVVVPANVTTAFCFNFERSILLFVGVAMSCNVIAVHAATAGAICEYAVQVHGVTGAVVGTVEVVLVDVSIVEVVLDDVDVEDVLVEGVVLVDIDGTDVVGHELVDLVEVDEVVFEVLVFFVVCGGGGGGGG